MKTILLLLAGLTAFSNQLFAQTYLTPRVGNEIDLVEKEYFGLFPMFPGFVSAKATSQNPDLTTFTITSIYEGHTKDSTIQVDTRTIRKLSKYIEGFESIRMNENEVNWSVFKGLAQETSVIGHDFHDPLGATVTTLDGRSIKGKLLWAEDSTLVLWKSDEPYNWRTVEHDASVIPVAFVSRISLEQQGGFGKGVGLGALTGFGLCVVYSVFNYKELSDLISGEANPRITLYLTPAIIAASGVVGGIISSILQPNYEAIIEGNKEKYLPILTTLTKSSVIDSYPPPELVHLINK